MFDRRLVTDISLALLIALPAFLPAAPTPWSTDDKAARAPAAVEPGPDVIAEYGGEPELRT